MGKHYLRRSRRHTPRFRHLKRTWAKVGQTNVDAPNIGPPTRSVADGAFLLDVIGPAPNFAVAYTITGNVVPVDPETGEWGTAVPWSVAPVASANATAATIATAIQTALNALAGTPLIATTDGATVHIAATDTDSIVTGVKALGRSTAAPTFLLSEGVPSGDEPGPEPEAPVVEARTSRRRRNG
jgi:hypothetical protein